MGMRGVIQCPVRANPPLLFVSWTKDGQALQLDKVGALAPGEGRARLGVLLVRVAGLEGAPLNSGRWLGYTSSPGLCGVFGEQECHSCP